MEQLARNADGDELMFVHAGSARLFCDFGHLGIVAGDYVVLPRGTMWRLEIAAPVDVLLIESTNASYMFPDKGLVGPHAIFDPAMYTPFLIAECTPYEEPEGFLRILVTARLAATIRTAR